MQTVKTVFISVLVLLILGAAAVGGLYYVSEHCGWETGTCN